MKLTRSGGENLEPSTSSQGAVRSVAGCLRFETIEIRCSNVRRVILVRPHLRSKPDRRADRSSPKCLPPTTAIAY